MSRFRMFLLAVGVVSVSLISLSARADVLKLTNGGEMSGTLTQVTLLVAGKEVANARDQVTSLWVSETRKDAVQLKDGTKLEGELVSVKFKSVGGELTFTRNDVVSVVFGDDARAAAQKELAAKKAKVAADDAKGLCELAEWCKTKGLTSDMGELARAALAANPAADVADRAHKLAGDVFYKDKWMTAAEAAKLHGAETPDPAPVAVDPPTAVGDKKLTPDEIKALKEAAAKNDELYKDYSTKVAEAKTDELTKEKQRAEVDWGAISKKADALKLTIKRKEDFRAQMAKGTGMTYSGRYYPTTTTSSGDYDGLAKDKKDLVDLQSEGMQVVNAAKKAISAVSDKAAAKKSRVHLAYLKHQRLLLMGKNLTADDMTADFEAAVKD